MDHFDEAPLSGKTASQYGQQCVKSSFRLQSAGFELPYRTLQADYYLLHFSIEKSAAFLQQELFWQSISAVLEGMT